MSGNNGRTECGAAHGAPNVNDLPRIATRMCRGWGLSVLKTSRERCRSAATDQKVSAHISGRMRVPGIATVWISGDPAAAQLTDEQRSSSS